MHIDMLTGSFSPAGQTLRHYMRSRWLEPLLTSGLFFTRVTAQQDKWEGHLSPGAAAEWTNWWITERMSELRDRVAMHSWPDAEKQRQLDAWEKIDASKLTKQFRDDYLLSCWSQDDDESLAMWAIYARKGVSVVSSVDRLRRCLSDLSSGEHPIGFLGRVLYLGPGSAIDVPRELGAVTVGFIKRPAFRWEREVRLAVYDRGAGTRRARGRAFRVPVHTLIERVLLSPWADMATETQVRAVVAKFAPGIEVSRSTLMDPPAGG